MFLPSTTALTVQTLVELHLGCPHTLLDLPNPVSGREWGSAPLTQQHSADYFQKLPGEWVRTRRLKFLMIQKFQNLGTRTWSTVLEYPKPDKHRFRVFLFE